MSARRRYVMVAVAVWVPCIVLGMLSYWFLLEPQMRRVTVLEAELMTARELYHQASEAADRQNQAELADTLEAVRDRVGDFVLRTEAAPALAFEIAEIANAIEVGPLTMRPQDRDGLNAIANCDLIGEQKLSVSFASPFHPFAALLNALERHRPVVLVETFAISRPQQAAGEPRVDMQLAVLVEKPSARRGL